MIKAARLSAKLLSMRHDGSMALRRASTVVCTEVNSSQGRIEVKTSLGREGEVSRQRD
jgi:hypothetical protein